MRTQVTKRLNVRPESDVRWMLCLGDQRDLCSINQLEQSPSLIFVQAHGIQILLVPLDRLLNVMCLDCNVVKAIIHRVGWNNTLRFTGLRLCHLEIKPI